MADTLMTYFAEGIILGLVIVGFVGTCMAIYYLVNGDTE